MPVASRRPNPVFTDEYAAIRALIVGARQRAGLSQRQLAARIGKCASHIAMIERGQRRVDTLELFVLAKALGRTPSDLFLEIVEGIEAVIWRQQEKAA
jgi:transcriptional regulator with XRE-family HTH domain